MENVLTWQGAVFSFAMLLCSVFITRNFKKADQTDKEVDTLNQNHATLAQKHGDLNDRIIKVESQGKSAAETIAANFVLQSQSLHSAITRAAETYARRDDLDKIVQKIDGMPDRLETRFRGILDDRAAPKI